MPIIPWSGDGLTANLTAEGTIPQDIFDKACVFTVEEARRRVQLLPRGAPRALRSDRPARCAAHDGLQGGDAPRSAPA